MFCPSHDDEYIMTVSLVYENLSSEGPICIKRSSNTDTLEL